MSAYPSDSTSNFYADLGHISCFTPPDPLPSFEELVASFAASHPHSLKPGTADASTLPLPSQALHCNATFMDCPLPLPAPPPYTLSDAQRWNSNPTLPTVSLYAPPPPPPPRSSSSEQVPSEPKDNRAVNAITTYTFPGRTPTPPTDSHRVRIAASPHETLQRPKPSRSPARDPRLKRRRGTGRRSPSPPLSPYAPPESGATPSVSNPADGNLEMEKCEEGFLFPPKSSPVSLLPLTLDGMTSAPTDELPPPWDPREPYICPEPPPLTIRSYALPIYDGQYGFKAWKDEVTALMSRTKADSLAGANYIRLSLIGAASTFVLTHNPRMTWNFETLMAHLTAEFESADAVRPTYNFFNLAQAENEPVCDFIRRLEVTYETNFPDVPKVSGGKYDSDMRVQLLKGLHPEVRKYCMTVLQDKDIHSLKNKLSFFD